MSATHCAGEAFIEPVERLEDEKKAIADDIRDVYAEAKGSGFDVKALRAIVRLRKQDTDEAGNSRQFWRRICMRSAWISGAEGTAAKGDKTSGGGTPLSVGSSLSRSFAAIVADHHAIACFVAGALLFG
jgi:uncharacterized protein (UPF0335 family)